MTAADAAPSDDARRGPRSVVVVGGGMSGLAAAWELTGGAQPSADAPAVIVLEVSGRLGGPLRTETFAGRAVDMGPDGFLARRPEATGLARELGLGDDLMPVGARGASVWARGKLRPLPEGHAMGIPTRFWPAARSGVLGLRGDLGLARDALLPRPDVRGPIGDRSVGPLVARKLGQRVVDVLVDPMLGGIFAGNVDDMSAAASFPPLLAAAGRRGSLMRSLRAEMPAPPPDPDPDPDSDPDSEPEAPPLFYSLRHGMASFVGALGDALCARGVEIRLTARVEQLGRDGTGWKVHLGGEALSADAVVLATPAPCTAALLEPHDDEAAALLRTIDYASAAVVTFRVDPGDVPEPLYGTGFLVPRRSPHKGRDPWVVTAGTFLDRKWPHLARDGDVLLRASLGRIGDERPAAWSDDETATRAWEELGALVGVHDEPLEVAVVRHDHALPQYRVHHLLRTAGVEAAVARLGHLAVAGSAYHGVGIPACIGSGRAAARSLS